MRWLLLLLCVGCTSEQREGHRMDFSLLRADYGNQHSEATSVVDGPGPREVTANSSSSSDDDGWIYGVGYSIPMGEDQTEGELRLMNAHLAGLRSEIAALSEDLRTTRQPVESQEAPEPLPATEEPVTDSGPPTPVQEPKSDTQKALTGAAAVAVVGLASFLAKKYLAARFMGGAA